MMAKASIVFVVLVLIFALTQGSEFRIPSLSLTGERVSMACTADHATIPIKSITWLKDGKEFLKYTPKGSRRFQVSNVEGVPVEEDLLQDGTEISIKPVTLASSGVYSCKTEIDHPTYTQAELSGSLQVVEDFSI